jgi:hypothetical protein
MSCVHSTLLCSVSVWCGVMRLTGLRHNAVTLQDEEIANQYMKGFADMLLQAVVCSAATGKLDGNGVSLTDWQAPGRR